jgi:predicted DCC family thiol-disulfide oxidoreductase YuxK
MRPATVLYDADCGVCTWAIAQVLAWDRRRRLRPVALQDPEALELLPEMDSEARMASWHLVSPEGAVHSAGAAIPPLLRSLPGGAPLAALAERWPEATERGYRWVAEHRGALGRPLPDTWKARAPEQVAERREELG